MGLDQTICTASDFMNSSKGNFTHLEFPHLPRFLGAPHTHKGGGGRLGAQTEEERELAKRGWRMWERPSPLCRHLL